MVRMETHSPVCLCVQNFQFLRRKTEATEEFNYTDDVEVLSFHTYPISVIFSGKTCEIMNTVQFLRKRLICKVGIMYKIKKNIFWKKRKYLWNFSNQCMTKNAFNFLFICDLLNNFSASLKQKKLLKFIYNVQGLQ